MIEEREVVRHAIERLAPPEPSFDRMLRRRDRRRRNERLTAAVTGVAIFAAAVWAIATSGTERTSQPAVPSPTFAPSPAYPGPVGLQELPPEGATPSSPASGELVLSFFFGHTMGDPGRFGLNVYEDGRMIWQRLGDGRTEGLQPTGLIEQRLSPLGVDLVTAEVLSTGLFDRNRDLASGHGLFFGDVRVRNGDRMVRINWDVGPEGVERVAPTREQARELIALDTRLLNPASWLPESAWVDKELKPFVPSMFSVCYDTEQNVGLDRVLAGFPPRAQDILRSLNRTYEAIRGGANSPTGIDLWCSRVSTEQARSLGRILDDAGGRGIEGAGQLGYLFGGRGDPRVTMWFHPVLPHDV